VPVFNEAGHIALFYKELTDVWKNLHDKYDLELIFVNDGSTDDTDTEIKKFTQSDARVKYLEFSRNFGKEIAVSAGLKYASGDAAVIIDGDLQHPVELMPQFIALWEKGAEVVVGVIKSSKNKNLLRKHGSRIFYTLLRLVGDSNFVPHGTDYRLLDRKVINAFNNCTERNRITRGLIDWLGFKRELIYFDAKERRYGKPTYSLSKLSKLFMNSFVSLSFFPLKLAGYLGLLITLIACLFGTFILTEQYILRDPLQLHFSGSVQLAVINMFLVGIVLICLGLIALYIANMHTEILNRPFFIIRNKENFD